MRWCATRCSSARRRPSGVRWPARHWPRSREPIRGCLVTGAVALRRVASERARRDGALGAAVEALERAVALADEGVVGAVQLELLESLVAAGRFERARELGERLSFGPRGEGEMARVHLALAQTALIRLDWDEAERWLAAARGGAGSGTDVNSTTRSKLDSTHVRKLWSPGRAILHGR